jgi:hypothetical protein
MKIVLAALMAMFVCALPDATLAVEIQCAKHKQLVGLLAKKYQENPVAMGTVNSDRYMQLFVSAKGTWTVLMTKADGEACIVAAGQNWEKLPALADADPAA